MRTKPFALRYFLSSRCSATMFAMLPLLSGLAGADVVPNVLFSEGAVLQGGQMIPVWGAARDGEAVTVELQGQKLVTTAKAGKWRVDLKPLKAGGPFSMVLKGDNAVTINNILVGEVWVCSGQSNMEWTLQKTYKPEVEAPKANYPELRMFTVKKAVAAKPRTEVAGKWVTCTPASVKDFSAVGYYFARDIHKQLGVPVGMIHTSWGGTPAEAWTSVEGLSGAPELQEYYDAAARKMAGYDAAVAGYATQMADYQTKNQAWNKSVGVAHKEALNAWSLAVEEAKKAGKPANEYPAKPNPSTLQPQPPAGLEENANDATALFNGMLAPIIPYGIKGSIWYQGESNVKNPRTYQTLFPAMVADWRKRWNQGDFPFFYVQIAPFKTQTPEIREAQFLSLKKISNSAMAVTTDVGDANDIHPRKKEPVGQRLALAARAVAYGEKLEYSGPLYQSMTVAADKITLHFDHIGSGLMAKEGALQGFTIADATNNFVPANAEIKGDTVVVSAAGIKQPLAVRYGWENAPVVNLFNREGLPASPFRTDVPK